MSLDQTDEKSCNPTTNTSLNDLINQAVSRRTMMKTGLGIAAVGFLSGLGLSSCSSDDDNDSSPAPVATTPERMLGFKAVGTSSADMMVVPEGYVAEPFLPWGDPISATAPAFLMDASQGFAAQEQQLGDNHDGMHFFGFNAAGTGFGTRSDEGLLVLNHEYINPEYFYAPGSDADNWLLPFTLDKVKKAQAAHGVSVVHIRRAANGTWSHVKSSAFNRRLTGYSPMTLVGPAAGNDMLKTAADSTGRAVLGTLNNCANGMTPWGTYLTCEENFNGYFGANGSFTPTALQGRYGISAAGFGYMWHTVDSRFDVNATPNEPNRFGWIVEIDPFNPTSTPVKHTALGRFKHENVALVVAKSGHLVAYMGDDERNEYIYKFVSTNTYSPSMSKADAMALLDSGTLYVAKLGSGLDSSDGMGNGQWLALVHGQNGLTEANGWVNQADILIRARQAADRAGATMMDRPEWVAANPKKAGEVFITMTNNNRRRTTDPTSNNPDGSTVAGSANPAPDEANPRVDNRWGQIMRLLDAGGNSTATSFAWDLFLVAGNPGVFSDARAGSANIDASNMFNSPDGLGFDSFGRLWIQTDGSSSNAGNFLGQGNNQMLAADPLTGEVRRFLVGPSACEITGLTFTPDRKTLFVNIQHPGEIDGGHPLVPAGTTFNSIARNPGAFSNFPSGVETDRPRSCTVIVRRSDGGVIGEGNAPVVTKPKRPTNAG